MWLLKQRDHLLKSTFSFNWQRLVSGSKFRRLVLSELFGESDFSLFDRLQEIEKLLIWRLELFREDVAVSLSVELAVC